MENAKSNRRQELNSANNKDCPRSSVPDQAEIYTMAGSFTDILHNLGLRGLPA
jgi:hypothetical protein